MVETHTPAKLSRERATTNCKICTSESTTAYELRSAFRRRVTEDDCP